MANDSNKKQKKKGVELPDWINKADWDAFVKMRTKIKKPLSERAANQAIKALGVIRGQGQDPNLALQFADYQCNRGIFPVPVWYKKMMGIQQDNNNQDLGNF